MRFAIDTGGTFTDLVVEEDDGRLTLHKAPTTPPDPVSGMLDAIGRAAEARGIDRAALLQQGTTLIHGTTHAINAIITGRTAKTAFLTTQGHPDILVLREGGRMEPFNYTVPFPEPYIPRALTFQVPERTLSDGRVIQPLDENKVVETLGTLKDKGVVAIAVCLLWSIVRPDHERRIGELIEQYLPGVPYSLSHKLNPSLREYRRASSTAIDASLKPLMGRYMRDLSARLKEASFDGQVLIVTSQGGLIPASEAAEAPIHLINSGPSMAPVAGLHFIGGEKEAADKTAIVADTGGTTYDISLIRKGRIPLSRETWIGQPYRGHLTGFPSVDVRSIGAGGGSIAWVDKGGLLHVGPQSAGAVPGPAAYGRGGDKPTVTDASLVLGHLDPDFFLGGAMPLDVGAAEAAIRRDVADPLGLTVKEAAASILDVMSEHMVQAIMDITVNQGVDPRDAVLIGGGGAAGLNSVGVARRLGCPQVLFPDLGAALSASGALVSDLTAYFRTTFFCGTRDFDQDAVNKVLDGLRAKAQAFFESADVPGDGNAHEVALSCEARYPEQVWEVELPMAMDRFESAADVERLVQDFHALHEDIFAFADREAPIEVVTWAAAGRSRLVRAEGHRLKDDTSGQRGNHNRPAYFSGVGEVDTPVLALSSIAADQAVEGPAIIETSYTTIVVDPGSRARREPGHGLVIEVSQ